MWYNESNFAIDYKIRTPLYLEYEVVFVMKKEKLQRAVVICYGILSVLFLALFLYMGCFEGVSIQKTRDTNSTYIVDNYTMEEIEDTSAPIGIRREYRWTMDSIDRSDSSLAFYLVHHYTEVYFGDELVYSLMPRETNRIGKSISSNWVIVPIYPEDSGKEIRVVATPVYESVRGREIEFEIGTLYSLYSSQLKKAFPQLILSALCIVVGIAIMLVQIMQRVNKRTHKWSIFYLGNFTMMFGIWKITDTRFSPFLFKNCPMVLGYISIGALFLSVIPFLLYIVSQSTMKKISSILVMSVIACGTALIAYLLQASGVADLRQTLLLAHIVIGLSAIVLFTTVVSPKIRKKEDNRMWYWKLSVILVCGCALDLMSYYLNGNSAGLVFTLFGVLVYTLLLFVIDIFYTSKMAYTDARTGLFNKAGWDVLMNNHALFEKTVGMMMLDLNRLKYINDTMGHEAGDKMIYNFANILRNNIPASNTICRWGGDEFTVLILNANQEIMEQYMRGIREAVNAYNDSGEIPALYYAAGYVLSTEFPGLSPQKLLEKADERMYIDKKNWYKNFINK